MEKENIEINSIWAAKPTMMEVKGKANNIEVLLLID